MCVQERERLDAGRPDSDTPKPDPNGITLTLGVSERDGKAGFTLGR
jgi:hypothetical protein